MINPALGVCYYPEQWPEDLWAEDARRMAELGLKWVRIGEFAWSKIEPNEGVYNWGWLDRAISTLGQNDLKVILGTPTATPPRWMVDKFPDMLAIKEDGTVRKFGSRRHYCFSHQGYKAAAVDMTVRLAKRYADNPHIHAWQTDNEYGCHDTTLSYSAAAHSAFQKWLSVKYKSIDALNAAWGNVFWSMDYQSFSQIELPNLTVTEPNPAHAMDFRLFSSDQVRDFNQAQAESIKAVSEAPVMHNYMGGMTDFDHFDVGENLDIASWDSYPLGFLEDRVPADEPHRQAFMRQGDPDYQALHHDLYRAVGRGRWGIMEQQPGPVNWAPYNPVPAPGMVRLWTWEAFAHEAEFVNYFRWRQAPFGQEQMHAGLMRPDNEETAAFSEVKQVAEDLKIVGNVTHTDAPVAIIFDYASAWAWDIQPQGQEFSYLQLILSMYRGLRQLGISVDILPSSVKNFGAHKCVLIPGLFCWTPELRRAVIQFKGHLLIGPRSGSKTAKFQIPTNLPPDIPGLDIQIEHVESLRPGAQIALSDGGHIHTWFEKLQTTIDVMMRTSAGDPVLVASDKIRYLGSWPDEVTLNHILKQILDAAGVETLDMPSGLRVRDLGNLRLFVNYGTETVFVPHTLHTLKVEPHGILLVDRDSHKVLLDS